MALEGLGEQKLAQVAHGTLQAEVEARDHLVAAVDLVDLALGLLVVVEALLEDRDHGTHLAAAAVAVHLGVLDHENHLGAEEQDQGGPDVRHQAEAVEVVAAGRVGHVVRHQVAAAAAVAAGRAGHDVRHQAGAEAAAAEEEGEQAGHGRQVVAVEQEDHGARQQVVAVRVAVLVAHGSHCQLVWEGRAALIPVLAHQQASGPSLAAPLPSSRPAACHRRALMKGLPPRQPLQALR